MKRLWTSIILAAALLLPGCQAEPPEPETIAVPVATETVSLPETEPTMPPETEPEATWPPYEETARATVLAAGDIMTHLPVINAGRNGNGYRFDPFFRYIADYVTAADFAAANLETTLAGMENGDKYSGFPKFNCPDAMADAVQNAGFDMLLTANNHTYDTGEYGMLRTQQVIRDRELLNLGTQQSAQEEKYRIVEVNGIRIGMICYTYGVIDPATGQEAVNGLPLKTELAELINVFDYERLDRFYGELEQHLDGMRAQGAEALMLFIHWGNEYRTQQNSWQTGMAQALCDLGIDVIIGGHPHVVQGVELLESGEDPKHQTLCIYSVGNLLSNQRASNMDMTSGHTEDGVLVSVTFVKYSDGSVHLEDVDFLPTWVCVRNADGKRTYDILPLDESVPNWKEAFGLTSAELSSARSSLERTREIMQQGVETASQTLARLREARLEEHGIFGPGVG